MKGFKSGISSSCRNDSFVTSQKLAREALINGNIKTPSLCLAFCSGSHDHNKFFEGLQSVLSENVPIIGGSCVGVITNDNLYYSSIHDDEKYHAALALLEFPNTINFRLNSTGELNINEEKAGRSIAKQFKITPDDNLMLLIYDSIKEPPNEGRPPFINSAASMLAGMTDNTFRCEVPIIGCGVMGDYNFNKTKQFCGSSVETQNIVAAIFSGAIEARYCITHGCSLLSGVYYKVTKAEGPCLYELDGQPVVEKINDLFGNDEWQRQTPLKTLTIGVNQLDKFSEFNENNYNNRLIVGPTPDKKGIVLFEADIKEGDEIQFMLRDGVEMIDSARLKSRKLVEEIRSKGEKPVFGIYIDCAGRSALYSGTDREEAAEIQKTLNENNIPLLGFYSGVEIAPVADKVKSLDWTGVLLILTIK